MRYFWIAVIAAILHRLAVQGIGLLGFGLGMTAFSGSSAQHFGPPLMGLAAILDFPAIAISQIVYFFTHGSLPGIQAWWMYGASTLRFPWMWQIVWSGIVGCSVAGIFMYRSKRKKGYIFGPAWTSGL